MKRYKNKDWLREQYRQNKKTQVEIAEECQVSDATISYWVHKHGLQKWMTEKEARENPLEWSSDIAYLSGLITSDGSLRRDKPAIKFTSKDKNLVEQVVEIAENELGINHCHPRRTNNNAWRYYFTSRQFYYFLEDIGLMPNKSNKIGKLDIPDDMFFDWLRGETDGDGQFQVQHKSNEYLNITIFSGSYNFLNWINEYLHDRGTVEGQNDVYKGNECYRLSFYHKDSQAIAREIYNNANYFWKKKYSIAKDFI